MTTPRPEGRGVVKAQVADGKHGLTERFHELTAHDGCAGQAETAEVVHRGDEAPPPCRIESAAEQSGGDPVVPAPREPGYGLQILRVGERPVRLLGGPRPMAPRAVECGEHEPVNHRVARAAFGEPWGELLLGVVVVGQRVYRVAHDSLLFLGPDMRPGGKGTAPPAEGSSPKRYGHAPRGAVGRWGVLIGGYAPNGGRRWRRRRRRAGCPNPLA